MFDVRFKEKWASEIGVLIVRRPDIPAPERDIEEIEIAGRDGILMPTTSRLEPIEIEIEMNFRTDPEKWGDAFRVARRWLTGDGNLMFSDDPEVFYKVYNVDITSSERTSRWIGTFEATFLCDPYTYFKEGDAEQMISDCEFNPYSTCHPLYMVEAQNEYTLTVNGHDFSGVGNTYIDTEKQIAYNPQLMTVKNSATLGSFTDLYLLPVDNEISITGGDLKIIPRWRSL